MKKTLAIILILFLACGTLASCLPGLSLAGTHKITFVYNNGQEDYSYELESYGYVKRPEAPERENYVFGGWYKNAACTLAYDFTSEVSSDITLYAKWTPDYEEITNELMATAMRANLKVVVAHLKAFSASYEYVTGSAVIFAREGNTYYALTNNHVVKSEITAINTAIAVYDAYGNESRAVLMSSSAEYDLAVLRFESDVSLECVNIDNRTPDKNEAVIAVGQPNGQMNCATYGAVVDIDTAGEGAQSTTSNVTFPVFWHTADIGHGSSGGALLDLDLELIGLNYATSTDESGNFAYGFSIPAEKIVEFLNEFFYSN